ncbi:SDR family oxidoreductase [Nocardia sp. NBC_00508]|uniref:SDR family oxidoreductase n=1 Tax=Nocardia sp. NBC_00508 TaxID=2975992 RepID=UPI002E810095|nr:SDR family oxidoreductase [Nocardia sp. NBC_00508]WUD65921.1 SDR family oxidoreductase [Nocardia sp. NBC_00508]
MSTDLWFGAGGMAAQVGSASGSSPEDVVKSVGAAAATGRFTTPQEVADLAVFLANDRSANITGSDIRIDGGYVTTV